MTTQVDVSLFTARFRRCLEAGDFEGLSEILSEDCLLDASVPSWRFQRKGPGAVIDQFREWYPDGGGVRITNWKEHPAPWGAFIEADERLLRDGVDYYSRYCWALFTSSGSLVDRIVLYCAGMWDPETLERNLKEAPIIKW